MRRLSRCWTMSFVICVVLSVPAVVAAQTTPVLAVVPQGAVIDAATFPDLAVGATFSFRRAGGDATELAHGAVTDIRDGHALVDVSGGAVNTGDVALRCATAASQTQLRTSLDQIKAQTTASPATPDVQLLGDLDTTVQARESAVNTGTCDVSALDQKLAELGAQLQQAMTPSSSSGSSASAPSGTTTSAGVATDTTTATSSPTTGTTSGTAGTSTGATGDSLDQAFQLMSKLFKLVQGLGSGDAKSRSDSDAGSTSQTGSDAIGPAPQPPTFSDPGAGSTPPPPPTAAAPPPSPPAPTTDVVSAPSPSQPPSVGGGPGTAPSTGTPPPPSATTPPPPSTGAAPPSSGTPPRVVTPSPPPWWTAAKPKPVVPPSGGNAPSTPAPPNPLQGIVIHPGTTVPGGLRPTGPIAATRPGVIHGRVLGDVDGRPGVEPVRGASVLISDGPGGTADRRATTNDLGTFTFAGLAAGRYSVMATAAGFRPATVTISVTPGDDVPMSLTLQRQAAPTPARPRPAPVHVPPPHTRTQSP